MKPRVLSLDAFKAEFKSTGKSLGDDILVVRDADVSEVKALGVEPGNEADARVFEWTLSTQSPEDDRSNDFIAADGWRLDRFRKNPVALWAHDSGSPPIGNWPAVWPESDRLRGKLDFSQTYDVSAFARMICQMVGRGVLRAASVGFLPVTYGFSNERGGFAMDFVEQELLECSVVPVPANAEALQGAKSAGVDLAPMVEWAEKLLDGERGPGLWLPKSLASDDLIERARAIAKGSPASVSVPATVGKGAHESTREIAGSGGAHNPTQAGATPAPATTPETPTDAIKTLAAVVEKAGRVLSAANESSLREAADSIQAAAVSIEGVLAKLEPADDGKSKPPPATKSEPAATGITRNDVTTELKAVLPGLLRELITEATDQALRQRAGRLD